LIKARIFGLIQSRLYQGSWNLEDFKQDFRLTFRKGSWIAFNKKFVFDNNINVFTSTSFAASALISALGTIRRGGGSKAFLKSSRAQANVKLPPIKPRWVYELDNDYDSVRGYQPPVGNVLELKFGINDFDDLEPDSPRRIDLRFVIRNKARDSCKFDQWYPWLGVSMWRPLQRCASSLLITVMTREALSLYIMFGLSLWFNAFIILFTN
jgi:hypothetical protein